MSKKKDKERAARGRRKRTRTNTVTPAIQDMIKQRREHEDKLIEHFTGLSVTDGLFNALVKVGETESQWRPELERLRDLPPDQRERDIRKKMLAQIRERMELKPAPKRGPVTRRVISPAPAKVLDTPRRRPKLDTPRRRPPRSKAGEIAAFAEACAGSEITPEDVAMALDSLPKNNYEGPEPHLEPSPEALRGQAQG